MNSSPQRYRLFPGPTRVTLTLLRQSGAYFTVADDPRPVQRFICGPATMDTEPLCFEVHSPLDQVAAHAEVAHHAGIGEARAISSAFCHLYFRPGGPDWIWRGAAIAGDSLSVLADGEGPHAEPVISFRPPAEPEPRRTPPDLPCLDAGRVLLLDSASNGNMIFRGNLPLSPAPGGPRLDFDRLHTTLALIHFTLTGRLEFPGKGRYVLRLVSLLDRRTEGHMLAGELDSFGDPIIDLGSADGPWHPHAPRTVSESGMLAQIAHWPVPSIATPGSAAPDLYGEIAGRLREAMNSRDDLPHVYFIHCADGGKRVSALSAWYLLSQRDEAPPIGSRLGGK